MSKSVHVNLFSDFLKRYYFFVTCINGHGFCVTKDKILLFRSLPKMDKGASYKVHYHWLSGLGGREGVMVGVVECLWE